MTTIFLSIIFTTSLVGLCGMVLYRQWEIKNGKALVTQNINEPLFPMKEIMALAEKCYTCVPREYTLRLLERASVHGKNIIQKSTQLLEQSPIKKRLHAVIDAIKGKHIIERGVRPSSPFIQDILAHKEQIRNNNREGEV